MPFTKPLAARGAAPLTAALARIRAWVPDFPLRATRWPARARRQRAALVVCAVGLVGLAACNATDIVDAFRVRTYQCLINFTGDQPRASSITFGKEVKCPVQLFAPSQVRYTATAQFDRLYGMQVPYVDVQFRKGLGGVTGSFYEQSWTQVYPSQETPQVVQITGWYQAASAWNQNPGVGGADTAFFRFQKLSGGYFTARAELAYQNGPPLQVVTPTNVLPYDTFTASATVLDPRLNGPLTYAWYVNGSFVSNDPTLVLGSGGPGDLHQIMVQVSDESGLTVSGSTSVQVKTCDFVGCNDQ